MSAQLGLPGEHKVLQSDAGGAIEIGDRFGHALAAGDFDGDGFLDLAVGSPGGSPGAAAGAGAALLYRGSSGGIDFDSGPFGRTGFTDGDRYGEALAIGHVHVDVGIVVARREGSRRSACRYRGRTGLHNDLWYKEAVVYCLDVETYRDGNGDGIGDFAGLTQHLEHIGGLGATCIWLLPFYPTPNRDNGYDVTDYYSVDRRLGTLGDFVDFMHRARERGIRVLVDLVVNHTSIEHPWFQAARCDPDSPYRDYYVWSDEPPETPREELIFPGVQEDIWSWDEAAGAYYLHRFYRHQPDLNIANPAVREEIRKIMGFWLELGVSGFRVDAAPYLIEMKGIEEEVGDPHQYLDEFRDFLSWRRGDAILLAEANVAPEHVRDYVGEGDRLHMLFNFILNQHLFLALVRGSAEPLRRGLELAPELPGVTQWANFVRNHDELTLDKLDEADREEVIAAFAPEEAMRLYGHGVRRRLAPMLDGDQRRIRLAYSLAFSLPGTPVLRYGEEIGMGDDLELPERTSVRTPMQWADDRNGGFSTADSGELIRPVVDEGPFSYQRVNVAEQRRDPESQLSWMERLVRTRRECPEFGWGEWELLDGGDPAVLAHACEWRGGLVLAVHNLSGEVRVAQLDLSALETSCAFDLLGDRRYREIDGPPWKMELEPYGFRWLRLAGTPGATPSPTRTPPPPGGDGHDPAR